MNNSASASTQEAADLRREIDRLKGDLQRLRTDFSTLADDAVHTAKTGTTEAKERLEQKLKAAAAKGRESVNVVEDQIASHPLMAVGIALAVGVAVGLAIPRRD